MFITVSKSLTYHDIRQIVSRRYGLRVNTRPQN